MKLSETLFFLNQISQGHGSIGAVMPTSRQAAQALVAEALRQKTPKLILEAGPGTGPITTELVKHLKASDRLVLCEINSDFVDYLHRRMEREPALKRVEKQIEILAMSVVDLPGEHIYDHIISSIPFTVLPAELIEEIFNTFERLLKPGGTLTFMEYTALRDIRKAATVKPSAEFLATDGLMRDLINRYQYRNEKVILNLPPATIRSLRFSEPPADAASRLTPRENFARLGPKWSKLGMATDGLDIVAGCGLLAGVLAARSSKLWPIPLALGAAAAWMHRDPHREVQPNPDAAFAASDGHVLKVDTIRHPRLGDQEWVRIAVYVAPTEVHINRIPVAGKIVDRWEEPKGFMPKHHDESERDCARYLSIESLNGRVVVGQRSGSPVHRIVTWPKKNELVAQGERMGLIYLGSRTDVLFPANNVVVKVKAGDKVVAGQTVIANFIPVEQRKPDLKAKPAIKYVEVKQADPKSAPAVPPTQPEAVAPQA
jgi:phosphatidylserine decarboxylase